MEKYVKAELEVLEAAAEVISTSITYDENEAEEDMVDEIFITV